MKYRHQYLGIFFVLAVSIISVLLSRGADRAVSWAVEVAYLSAVIALPLILIASFFGRRNPASLKTIAVIGLGLILHQIVANNP